MAYNEIEIQISTNSSGYDGDNHFSMMHGFRFMECEIILTHSIAENRMWKDTVHVMTYKATASDVIEAARQCFQNILDKQFYNQETQYHCSNKVKYSGDWRKLPWHLEISEHTPELQELIRSVFSGGEIFQAKALLEA